MNNCPNEFGNVIKSERVYERSRKLIYASFVMLCCYPSVKCMFFVQNIAVVILPYFENAFW